VMVVVLGDLGARFDDEVLNAGVLADRALSEEHVVDRLDRFDVRVGYDVHGEAGGRERLK
jgi:hypothetical protein